MKGLFFLDAISVMHLGIMMFLQLAPSADAFMVTPPLAATSRFHNIAIGNEEGQKKQQQQQRRVGVALQQSASASELQKVPADMEGVPIPFVDKKGNSFIECYADSVAKVNGVEYTIGVPCDYSVAICYFDENEALVPVELDDELMEDVFPIAEGIVAEEFGEELALQRTPQTLTLVGELDEDDEDDLGFEEDDDIDEDVSDEEEVEILLSFEHRGKDFNLVRLLDPILLVGKVDPDMPDNRFLLTAEESDEIMPILEEMFLKYHNDPDDLMP